MGAFMSKWVIDKQFSFCYGHRVWSQQLEKEFCEYGDYACKCRHLHGHEGLVHVFLEGESLERGMVTDFKHLGWLKNFLDTYMDHRFVLDAKDPMFGHLVDNVWKDLTGNTTPKFKNVVVPGTNFIAGKVLDLSSVEHLISTADYEVLEGYFIVDFVPTSENLSKWVYDVASYKMQKLNIRVSQVDWYETPKSRSSYRGE
jgi:6-pyruvoyltetrahydropterin/6-carboxytetrahydropterin synthase